MIPGPIPANEASRLKALRSLGVLDTPPDPGVDSVTRHLASLWEAPIATVSLLDSSRQWFKSRIGMPMSETPRSVSFCGHLLTAPEGPMIVTDALQDHRFADNPLVTGGPEMRFYAGAPLRDEAGHILGGLCVIDRKPRQADEKMLHALQELAMTVSSVLVLHRSVHRLEVMSETDFLTSILNRKGFERRLGKLDGAAGCLMLLDLDGFKRINDSFGHPAGDLVLCEVSRRIGKTLRRSDALARLGGDEFAVILGDDCTIREAILIANRIHRSLAAPFAVGATPVELATSIGIAQMLEHGGDHDRLYALADAALYAAKSAGRSNTRVAGEQAIARMPALIGRSALAKRLQAAAIEPDQAFELAFQPVFDVATGDATSVEALIRWTVDGEAISPAVFVPLAETLGVAPEIDRYVTRAASAVAAGWPAERRLAVNLSALTFAVPALEEDLIDLISATGFDHSRLTVELTETALSLRPDTLCRTLEQLTANGISIALDDFGAGQTSLSQLRQLPLRTLKIDRALVRDAAIDDRSRKILASIAGLGRALGIIVVAEGIETEAELAVVRRLGIPRVQGFLLSVPVPADCLEAAIEAGRKILAPTGGDGTGKGSDQSRVISMYDYARTVRSDPSSTASEVPSSQTVAAKPSSACLRSVMSITIPSMRVGGHSPAG